MYSRHLQEYIRQIGEYAQVDPGSIALLEKALACLISTLAKAIGAIAEPSGDLFDISVRLLLLSDGLAILQRMERLDGAHYLVGLGFEQTGALLARLTAEKRSEVVEPLENDLWYELTLAFLHYLAGGYRVQALSVLRQLESLVLDLGEGEHRQTRQYYDAVDALRRIYSVRRTAADFLPGVNTWYDLLFERVRPRNPQELRLQQLARRIRRRRDVVLAHLGEGDEANWLSRREVILDAATDFWKGYLNSLDKRGITAFTQEQVGEGGFDTWLRPGNDLLVVLPTGSGKTIIGELRSALMLAQGRQVLWMLPTRALVRQIKRELRSAFEQLDVAVEELPTTEDFIPLFTEEFPGPQHVAVTTPEKLASLLRSNPGAVRNVGLVVFDEAQTLLKEDRGTTAEYVLRQIRHETPQCDIVLMSASWDIKDSLNEFLVRLGRQPDLLVSDKRPTRRIYGVITNDSFGDGQYVSVLFYPPGIQEKSGHTENPLRLVLKGRKPLPSKISPTDMAQRFVRDTTVAGLRTALFVARKDSTETQASKIARVQKQTAELPEQDIARLRVELGRDSVLEGTGPKGVAPHHAGLTPLEQTLVERWVRNGIVKTVVATPTLAEGVNLPLDFSVVTYTTRFTQSKDRVPVSPREIQNMLGRAGRAGYVSDGFGLLSIKRSPDDTARGILDDSRRIFFHSEELPDEYLGLSRLLRKAMEAKINNPDWLIELDGLSFSETQSVVTFALRAVGDIYDGMEERLVAQLKQFPSIQQLEDEKIVEAALTLKNLVENVRHQASNRDPTLVAVLERTGMPTEILDFFLFRLRSLEAGWAEGATREEKLLWADQTVRISLGIAHGGNGMVLLWKIRT